MLIKLRTFDKGLWLTPSIDGVPEGGLRRARGLSPLKRTYAYSRNGASLLHALNAHSIYYYNDIWHYGVGPHLYRASTIKTSDLSGERLSFAEMPPTLGKEDYLFVAGGGTLYKLDSSGNLTGWGIDAPTSGPSATATDGTIYAVWDSGSGTTSSNISNYHFRNIIPNAEITDQAGDYVRVKFTASGGSSCKINLAYIGQRDGATYDMTAAPAKVQLTFNDGDSSVEIDASDSIWSDWVAFTIDGTDDLIFSVDFGTVNRQLYYPAGTALNKHWAGTQSADTDAAPAGGVTGSNIVHTAALQTAAIEPGNMDGTFKYKVTYKNTTSGHRSDAYETEEEITVSAATEVSLSSIPTSDDDQVDARELWRTTAGGAYYFLLDTVEDNTTTTYTDTSLDDDLSATILPTDNLIPYSWFEACFGPHNGAMFWITRTEAGERGRLYYSPSGRPESVDGFIEVTSDYDPLQRVIG